MHGGSAGGLARRGSSSDEGEALEIQASARELRRRQLSENSALMQRRHAHGESRTSRVRGTADVAAAQPPSTPATPSTSAPPSRSRIWTPLFFLLNFLSMIPSLIGFLYSAHRFYTTPRLVVSSLKWETSGVTYSRSTKLDWFVSGMWALACAYFTHSLARGLLKRWLVYYPLGPTIVRVLSLQAICWPLTLTTHRVLSFDQPVAAWFVCATTAAISNVIQSWVTSNIVERKDRRGHPRWKFVSSAITAVLGPGIRTDKYRKGERVLSWKRVLWGTALPFAVLGWATTNALLWQQFVARYKGGGGIDLGPPKLNTTSTRFASRLANTGSLSAPADVRILLLVASSWSDQSRLNRQTFRDTSLKLFHRSPPASVSLDHRFLLGTAPTPQSASKFGPKIEEEASLFGDMLLLPTRDSQDEAAHKLLEGWRWAGGSDVDYVIKTEDDTFVRLDTIARELGKLGRKTAYWRGFAYWDMPVSPQSESDFDLAQFPPYTDSSLHILSHDLVSSIAPASTPRRMTKNEDQSLGVWLFPTGVRPLHDHRIQHGRVCENDLIAKRFGRTRFSEGGANDMFRNIVLGKALCDGFTQRWCGVCYPSCRKRDFHWKDAGIICDEMKGATLSKLKSPSSASSYDISPVRIPPPPIEDAGSRHDPWLVPDVLSFRSSPLSRSDDWHLLHWLVWTEAASVFGERHSSALETIFAHEPRATVVVLSTTLDDTSFEMYRELGYAVRVVKVGKAEMLERAWHVGRESERWLLDWDLFAPRPNFDVHLADYLRYFCLYRFGGTLIDPDTLWIRAPPDSKLEFIGTDASTLASDEHWVLDEEGTYLSNKVMRARPGWTLFKDLLETTFSRRYAPECPECTSSRALTVAYHPRRHQIELHGLRLLPSRVLYPRSWIDSHQLVKSFAPLQALQELSEWQESWSIHLFSKMTRHLPIQTHSIAAKVVEEFSLTTRTQPGPPNSGSAEPRFELRYPRSYQYRSRQTLSQLEGERVRHWGSLDGRFEGFDLILLRANGPSEPAPASIEVSSTRGGRVDFAPAHSGGGRGGGGGTEQVVFRLERPTLQDVNAILSSLRYTPPRASVDSGSTNADELRITLTLGQELIEGKIAITLL